jgi:hypothetical protein
MIHATLCAMCCVPLAANVTIKSIDMPTIEWLRPTAPADRVAHLPKPAPGEVECVVAPPRDADRGSVGGDTWPGGIVPFTFEEGLSDRRKGLSLDAIAIIEYVCAIDFVERTDEANYLRLINSNINSSAVGMQGGEQIVEIDAWSYPYVIVHELMHAIGIYHEQQRSDRDNYIRINWDNIQSGLEYNFTSRVARPHGDYDFDSLMHYGQCAFKRCSTCSGCQTITVLPPNQAKQNFIGQRERLSTGDKRQLRYLYGNPLKPGPFSLFAPADSLDALDPVEEITLEWQPSVDTARYRLALATTEDFAEPVITALIDAPGHSFTVPQATLLYGTTYFWTVTAENNNAQRFAQADNGPFTFTTIAPECTGDVNGDLEVDLEDFSVMAADFGDGPDAKRTGGDLNGDGWVNLEDFAILLFSFGNDCTTPRIPSTRPGAQSWHID